MKMYQKSNEISFHSSSIFNNFEYDLHAFEKN